MKLFQLKDGYRYNSDSLFLWDFARKNCSFKASQSLLDVGCGCGILGLLLARDFGCALTSIDIEPQNCELVQINAQANNINANVICADFFEDWESENFIANSRNNLAEIYLGNSRIPYQNFERIICNPPFYDFGGVNKNAHKNTSRNASSFDISAFASKCARLLAPKGELVMCYDARLADTLLAALVSAKLKPIKLAFLHSKRDKAANVVLVVAKKGAKSPLCVFGSLFACDESGTHSDFAKEVFAGANLTSVDLII